MPAPLSHDLRHRIVAATVTASQADVAARFAVGRATVQRLVYLHRSGSLAPKPYRARSRTVTEHGQALVAEVALVAEALALDPSLTQAELAARLADAGLVVSRQTVGRTLKHMGYTRKKRR